MVNPSFQIGQNIGAFEAKRIRESEIKGRESQDVNAIEKILAEAQATNDPKVLQNTMGKILSQVSPERQPQAIKAIETMMNSIEAKKKEAQGRQAAQQGGYTYGAPPAVQAEEAKSRAKQNYLQNYGLGGGIPQQQGQMQPMGGQAQPEQMQQQPNQMQGMAPQQGQQQAKRFPQDYSDQELISLQGAPYREISEPAKAALQQRQAEEKLSQKSKQSTREEQLLFHKESAKYEEELMKQRKIAKGQIETVKTLDKAIKSGNINPSSIANMFKGLGPIGDKISEAVINKDQATLLASIPQLLEGWKEVFGVRLSDADLRLLQDKLPSIGKNPEANLAITKILKKYAEMTLLRSDIAKEIKDSNKGLRPLGYADQIEERFDAMVAPVKMINPRNGKVMEVPAYKVSDAINAGGKLA